MKALLTIILLLFSLSLLANEISPELKELFEKEYQKEKELTEKNLLKLQKIESNIVGVELILADKSDIFIGSQWGHVMVRFVHEGGKISKDMVVSFEADVNEPSLSLLKGIYGGYGTIPVIRPLYEVWERYVRDEGRSLKRTIIPTNTLIRGKMIENLVAYNKNPKLLGRYRFFSNNCADGVAQFLMDSNFNYDLAGIAIPKNFNDYLERSLLNLYPTITIRGINPILSKASNVLGISRVELNYGRNFPSNAAERLIAEFDIHDLAIIYQEVALLPREVSRKLAPIIREAKLTPADYLGIITIDRVLYEACDDEICATENLRIAKTLFSASALKQKRKALNSIRLHYSTASEKHENSFLTIRDQDKIAILNFELWLTALTQGE